MTNLHKSSIEDSTPHLKFDIPHQHRNSSGIYAIKNLINSKVYIGSAVNFRVRHGHHFRLLKNGKHHNVNLLRSFTKYGFDNFTFQLLELCEASELLVKEQLWIEKFNSVEYGYNMCRFSRSALGIKRSQETKQKMSAAMKGKGQWMVGKARTEEQKQKFRSKMKGRPSKLKGIPRTEETKARVSKATTGRIFTEEHKRKLSEAHKGYVMPEEQKQKIAATNKARLAAKKLAR